MQARQFWLDTQTRSFVPPPDGLEDAGSAYFREDVENIQLYFVRRTPNLNNRYESVDYSAADVKLAVGTTQPAALVTSFSPISTAISITPSMGVTGGNGLATVQAVAISPAPGAGSYSLRLPARTVTVSSATASVFNAPFHGLEDGQSATLTGFTISSGFSNGQRVFIRNSGRDSFQISATETSAVLSVALTSGGGVAEVDAANTLPLAANTPPAGVQAALIAATGIPGISVTGAANNYSIFFGGRSAGTAFPLVEVAQNSLAGRPGLTANLNFNTQEIAALVAAGAAGALLEVEVSEGPLRHTYQRGVTIAPDIITSTSPIPAPTGDTVSTLNFDDGSGGTWTVTVDPNGVLTATKQ
jgi:hypothetical protein